MKTHVYKLEIAPAHQEFTREAVEARIRDALQRHPDLEGSIFTLGKLVGRGTDHEGKRKKD